MDISPLFKACVKNVKTKYKAFGLQKDVDKSRILKNKNRNSFIIIAKDISSQITRLRDFLLENRKAYLSFFNDINIEVMTDVERDQVDNGAQRIVQTCTHLIKDLKNDIRKVAAPSQVTEHTMSVVELLESYLRVVCKMHSEMKALRVKQSFDFRKLSKLEIDNTQLTMELTKEPTCDNKSDREDFGNNAINSVVNSESEVAMLADEEKLTAEELQIFESENRQLFNELNSLSEEVKQIESKVLHIAELQEIFTEKVLQQEHDIDRIATTVIGATENVKDANEQIKQAIQRNAGLRGWVLFFFIVMSFSLLFLDWYNE